MEKLRAYSLHLIRLIKVGEIKTRRQLNEEKIRLCKEQSIARMPTNATILSFAKAHSPKLLRLLSVKPTRSLSGITVVALMAPPSKCPGNCIYCPSSLLPGKKTPKSYTGMEPATMRALASNFSPKKQVESRLRQLQEAGHGTGKVELIVMGGTFPSLPLQRQRSFMLQTINAVTGSHSQSIAAALRAAETARQRITGITFETRPDFCGKREISRMLSFGGTRCELGVQTLSDFTYRRIRRGHTVADAIKATRLLKDSAFKVTWHYMPGLPGVSLKEDKAALKRIFSDQCFKPDALKIYPCLVIEGTELYNQWKKGEYKSLSTEKAATLLAHAKRFVPRWVRIMRIQRDIPAQLIAAGVRKSNLRQIVQQKMEKRGWQCNCIRCREAGLLSYGESNAACPSNAKLFVEKYEASNGTEFFLSFEARARRMLFAFLRLRLPHAAFRKEISPKTALVRELRVFGKPLPLHGKSGEALQHRGLGKGLLEKAEEIAVQELTAKKLLVISGSGVKPYYRSLGFADDGTFLSKKI